MGILVKGEITITKGFKTWKEMVYAQDGKLKEHGIKFIFAGTQKDDPTKLYTVVYVKPEYRRQGIYRAMYEQLQAMANASSVPVCGFRLYAEIDNAHAHMTYKDCGMNQCDYLMFEEMTD